PGGTVVWDEDETIGFKLGSEAFADFRGVILVANREGDVLKMKTPPEIRTGYDRVQIFTPPQQYLAIDRLWRFVMAASGGKEISKNLEY
ncbi:hypothetical protein ABTM51_20365, partial [Acinetobacter baumannii]